MSFINDLHIKLHFIIVFFINPKTYMLLYLQKDDENDCRLLIHQSLAGCVIGKGGSKIREIRDVSLFWHLIVLAGNVCIKQN